MPTVVVEDLEVKFPYEPYEIQKKLMGCVVKCIENRQHGLLESPTGTGKTASLLCASLAWQQRDKDRVRKSIQQGGIASGNPQQQKQQDPLATFALTRTQVPKIIYATRTHTQISQAVRELKRTQYNRVKTVSLGSRDIMCIHEEVSRCPESSTKIMACHMKVLGRTCAYYNNVQRIREQITVGEQTVMDIEELVVKGKSHRFCPFFMSKELVETADIIFMPYNYLLDPKLRSSHGVDLKCAIIILDEAHNITKVCEDSSSFDLRSSTLAQCIREVTKALNEFNDLTEELRSTTTKDLSMGEIVQLKAALLELEKALDEAPFSLNIPESGKTVTGSEVLRCFFSSGFSIDQLGRWIRLLDGVSSFLATSATEASGCDKFSGILRVLATRLLSGYPELFLSSYAVRVEVEARQPGQPNTILTSLTKPRGKVFHFWCMNPAVGLDLLLQHSPRCIMLASGTLSPIQFLENELQLEFPVKIQNPHIIQDSQLYAAVVKLGPGNVKLSSAYANRSRTEYLVSLGQVVKETASVAPEGMLVFFPSYSAMDQAVDYWKENGHWGDIAAGKTVFVEPRGKRALDEVMEGFYSDCERGVGSCLMAVCRGKVSEGLDFTDSRCRCVLITGLPYAPFKNEQVVSKMKYLDSKANGTQGVKGNVWYSIDAVRALNQAIGRIIRHRGDYGAILLCDERCDWGDVRGNLSGWVKERMTKNSSWADVRDGLGKFFRGYGVGMRTGTIRGPSLPSSSKNMSGGAGSFQYNSGSGPRRVYKMTGDEDLFEPEEPQFSKLYEGDGSSEETVSQKRSGGNKLLDFGNLGATTAPTVSFTASPSPSSSNDKELKEKLRKESLKALEDMRAGTSGGNPNPKKRIKLLTERSSYKRIVEKYGEVMRAGRTINHYARREPAPLPLDSGDQVRGIFSSPSSSSSTGSGLASSSHNKTAAVKPKPEPEPPKSFGTPREYAAWVKGKVTAEQYRDILTEFKAYKAGKDLMALLDFGKKLFPRVGDYKAYMKGIKIVATEADRSVIDDIIMSYDDLEES